MRALSFAALILGVLLIPTSLGLANLDHDRKVSETERRLVAETGEHGGALDDYFARARSIVLLTANSPAFANVVAEPGTRREKVRRQSRSLARGHAEPRLPGAALPDSIGEACFIDANGEEFARVVRGDIAPARRPVHRGGAGAVLRARPSRSSSGRPTRRGPTSRPTPSEWVVANATLIPQADGEKRAIVHFEVTVESFRRAMGDSGALRAAGHRRPHRPGRHRRRPRAADRRAAGVAARTRASSPSRAAPTPGDHRDRRSQGRVPAHHAHRRQRERLDRAWHPRRRRPAVHLRPWGRRRSRCSPSRC